MDSIHSASIQEIFDMPIECINRPIPSILDDKKVQSLMETIGVSIILKVH